MSKPLFIVTAPVATRSGYGSHSRDIIHSLLDIGKYDVKTFPVRWGNTPQNALDESDPKDRRIIETIIRDPQREITRQPDVHLHLVVPNEFIPNAKFNIGMTAGLETTHIPKEWIEGCNRMNLILVSSEHAKMSMLGSELKNDQTGHVLKVQSPVEVLFEGVDTNIYKPTKDYNPELVDLFKNKVKDNWNFLFVGHWLPGNLGQDRKDVGGLIKTFMETFKNKNGTGLILKTCGVSPSVMDKYEIHEKIKAIKNTVDGKVPNVYLLHGDFTDVEMNEIYNHPKVKANITFTHGEGFGRPLLEATLSEKPVIASNWSGHLDFLKGPNSMLIPGEIGAVPKGGIQDPIWQEGMGWFNVNPGAAMDAMKTMRKDYRSWKLKAKRLAMVNKKLFSHTAMTKKLEALLDQYLPTFTETANINLPNLTSPTPTQAPVAPQLPKLQRAQ